MILQIKNDQSRVFLSVRYADGGLIYDKRDDEKRLGFRERMPCEGHAAIMACPSRSQTDSWPYYTPPLGSTSSFNHGHNRLLKCKMAAATVPNSVQLSRHGPLCKSNLYLESSRLQDMKRQQGNTV